MTALSVDRLATALYVLLPLSMVAAALSAAAYFRRSVMAGDLQDDEEVLIVDADRVDGYVMATGFAMLLVAVTGVVFLAWFLRARRNLEVLAAPRKRLGPGWAVGGWFLPVANLWAPMRTAHDLVRDSEPQADEVRRSSGQLLVVFWWACFLAAEILYGAGTVYRGHGGPDVGLPRLTGAPDFVGWETGDRLTGASYVLLVPAGILLLRLIRRVTTAQSRLLAAPPTPPTPQTPPQPATPPRPVQPPPAAAG